MNEAGPENDEAESQKADETIGTGKPPETRAREIGGRPGPDPTRYGDWEKAGRCIDF